MSAENRTGFPGALWADTYAFSRARVVRNHFFADGADSAMPGGTPPPEDTATQVTWCPEMISSASKHASCRGRSGVSRAKSDRADVKVAAIDNDGSPHVTPVWADSHGARVLMNPARGRCDHRAQEHRPKTGIQVQDPCDRARYTAIRGRVVETTTDAAVGQGHELSERYGSVPCSAPSELDRVRVIVKNELVKSAIRDGEGQRDTEDPPLDSAQPLTLSRLGSLKEEK